MSRYQWPATDDEHIEADERMERELFFARRLGEQQGEEPAPPPQDSPAGPNAIPLMDAASNIHPWEPLGPGVVLGGNATGGPRIAGRINAIVPHRDGSRIYAASDKAIWFSGDGGKSWRALGGFEAGQDAQSGWPGDCFCSALSVTFDPLLPSDPNCIDIIYVGTGEVSHPTGLPSKVWLSAPNARPRGGVGILRAEHSLASGALSWAREATQLRGSGVYRIALEPGANGAIAATLSGLYQRVAASPEAKWERLSGEPFDTLDVECTDVVWTAFPERVWVWVQRGDSAGLWVRAKQETDFTHLPIPGAQGRRATLAASKSGEKVWVLLQSEATKAQKGSSAARTPIALALPLSPARPNAVADARAPTDAAGAPVEVLRGFRITERSRMWPGGIVPWTTTLLFDSGLRNYVELAIQHIEKLTNVRFVKRDDSNEAGFPNYVRFVDSSSGDPSSSVGVDGGAQDLLLIKGGVVVGSVIHELAHVLGLEHEMARPDRDDHVTILEDNLVAGVADEFKPSHSSQKEGPYDYNSITHYGPTDFGKKGPDGNPLQTIVPKEKNVTIGQRIGLSPGDVETLDKLYPGPRPRLFQATVTADGPKTGPVMGLPEGYRESGSLAMVSEPGDENAVALSGGPAPTTFVDGRNASILRATVTEQANGSIELEGVGQPDILEMGMGVPLGVNDLAFSVTAGTANDPSKKVLWAADDGGVFCSSALDSPVGFRSSSEGIHAAEISQFALHPFGEGRIVAALRDGSFVERVSSGIWARLPVPGGGGTTFDALEPTRFVTQGTKGRWFTLEGELELLTRRKGDSAVFAQSEHEASAPISVPASIAHRRGNPLPSAPNVRQLIIGTNRLWYSEDLGASWVTLPTGTDPLPADPKQDGFGEAITVCRWQGPDVAWVLGESRLVRYVRTPGSDAARGPGKWTWEKVLLRGRKSKYDETSAEGPVRDAPLWTDIAVNLDAPVAPSRLGAVRGTRGAVYLGTVGKLGNPAIDTLWWFDGTSTWYPTGLTGKTFAAVTAIACDTARSDEVYVGTTFGVWKGKRTLANDVAPTWAWEALRGLPVAPVTSLALFNEGGLRLLRACALGGAWELRLDDTSTSPRTYLRAHADDLRHRLPASSASVDGRPRSWHGSPDVRPRLAPGALRVPDSLEEVDEDMKPIPWTKMSFASRDREALRRFQAALRAKSKDQRVRPTGNWDGYFNGLLNELEAPLFRPLDTISKVRWERLMVGSDATAEPWDVGPPSEPDLLEFTPPLDEGELGKASCELPPKPSKVEVVVHRRGLERFDGKNVRVTLLKWVDPLGVASGSHSTFWFMGDVPWTTAVNEVLNSPNGQTSATFSEGWSFVGATPAKRRQTLEGQQLHALRSGVVTFDLDLSGLEDDAVVLLVAVIRADAEIHLQPDTLEKLALFSPNVAVRSLRIKT